MKIQFITVLGEVTFSLDKLPLKSVEQMIDAINQEFLTGIPSNVIKFVDNGDLNYLESEYITNADGEQVYIKITK